LTSSRDEVRQGEFSLRPMRILNQAMRVCDLPYGPLTRLGLRKAIYFGVLSEKALSRLKIGGEVAPKDKLSASDAIEYWKVVLLSKRAQHAETLERIKSFSIEQLRLGEKSGS